VELLIEAGADVNAREEFSTAFRTAQKKHMRSFDGRFLFFYLDLIVFVSLKCVYILNIYVYILKKTHK